MTPWPTNREPVPEGGTPLAGEDGVPVSVLAAESGGPVNGEARRLPAGMLLLRTVEDQQRFGRDTRHRGEAPIDGWPEQAWPIRNGTPYELRVRVPQEPR